MIEIGSTRVLTVHTATVRFTIPDDTGARLQIGLRGPLVGSEVTLTDPPGRVRVTPNEVQVTPSAELGNPRLGDLADLPHILEPEGGTWRLEIDELPQGKTVFAFISLAAHHQVTLYTDGSVFSVGQPVLVQVQAIELGGVSDIQPAAIQVRQLEQDRVTEVPLRPQQEVIGWASAARIPTLLAVWRPVRTGAHELQVELRSDGRTVVEATRTVNVIEAPIHLLTIQPSSATNRASARITVDVHVPALYTFTVTYTDGNGRQREANGTWQLDQGETQVAVPLKGSVESLQRMDIAQTKDGQFSLVVRKDLEP